VPVLGGNHGQFGDNVGGMYKELDSVFAFLEGMEAEKWEVFITRDEQQAIIVKAMFDWFSRILDADQTDL